MRTSLVVCAALLLSLACLTLVVDAKPKVAGQTATGASAAAAGAAGARGAGARSSSSSSKVGRVTEDPALFKPIPVRGAFDANTLGAFHPKPKAQVNAAAHNWNAPRRKYRLKELASKVRGLDATTKTRAKVGPKKAMKSGPRSKPARGGAIPRPTGVKGKFTPKTASKEAFGRGPPVKPVKAAKNGEIAATTPAGKASSKATNNAAAAAGAGEKKPRATRTPRAPKPTTVFVEVAAEEADAGADESSTTPRALVEHATHAETVTVVENETHQLVEAEVVGEAAQAPDDLVLPSGLRLSAERIAKIAAGMAKTDAPRVFYHWGDYKSSIRWGRARRIEKGEIDWLNTQNEGMAAGGGYYLAQDPKASYGYGPVPCYIFVPAGTLVMTNDQKAIIAVLGKELSLPDKAALGGRIPFLHSYNTKNGWWVTHHTDVLSNIRCGNAIITPDPLGPKAVLNPTVNLDSYADIRKNGLPADSRFVQVHFDELNGQVVTAKMISNQFDAHNYVMNMIEEKWDDQNAALGRDVSNAASWVNSFYVLMQYIDGLSLVRAKKVFPSDPWQAFEPNNFGNFLSTFNKYVKMRAAGQTWGIAPGGVFGAGEAKEAWAKKMVEVTLPGLYRELSGGGELKFRTHSVRAGGPIGQDPNNKWTTGSFIATAGQIKVMQANPYLSVETGGPAGADPNLILTNYFYPDPQRLSGITADMISPEMLATIKSRNGYTDPATGPAALAADTEALQRDLLYRAFLKMHNTKACSGSDFQGALKAALTLVSIHPCADFNGRSTRFFMYVAALEGCGIIPVSFMSDFDIVTQFSAYNTYMQNANAGYLQLKVAMLSELISSLANNVVARQYDLPEWGTFLSTAFSQFGKKQFGIELTDQENEMVRTRDFVPIMDKWFGTAWPTRNTP